MRTIKKTIAILLTAMLLLSITSVGVFAIGSEYVSTTNIAVSNFESFSGTLPAANTVSATRNSAYGGGLSYNSCILNNWNIVDLQNTDAFVTGTHTYAARAEVSSDPNGIIRTGYNQTDDAAKLDAANVNAHSTSFDFWIPTTMEISVSVAATDTAGKTLGTVVLEYGGAVTVKNSAGEVAASSTYTRGAWHRLETISDPELDKLSVKLDDTELAGFSYSTVEGQTGKVAALTFGRTTYTGDAEKTYYYIDNMSCDEADLRFGVRTLSFVKKNVATNIAVSNFESFSGTLPAANTVSATRNSAYGGGLSYNSCILNNWDIVDLQNTDAFVAGTHTYAARAEVSSNPNGIIRTGYNQTDDAAKLDAANVNAHSTSFDFWIPATMQYDVGVAATDTAGKTLGKVVLGSGGAVTVKNSAGEVTANSTYTRGTWHRLEMISDPELDKLSVKLDDTELASFSYSALEGQIGKVREITLGRETYSGDETNSYYYIDNMSCDEIKAPAYNNNVEMKFSNQTGSAGSVEMIIAEYDADGMMISVNRETMSVATGVSTYSFTENLTKLADTTTVKAFVWDNLTNVKPLINAISE